MQLSFFRAFFGALVFGVGILSGSKADAQSTPSPSPSSTSAPSPVPTSLSGPQQYYGVSLGFSGLPERSYQVQPCPGTGSTQASCAEYSANSKSSGVVLMTYAYPLQNQSTNRWFAVTGFGANANFTQLPIVLGLGYALTTPGMQNVVILHVTAIGANVPYSNAYGVGQQVPATLTTVPVQNRYQTSYFIGFTLPGVRLGNPPTSTPSPTPTDTPSPAPVTVPMVSPVASPTATPT